MEHLFNQLEQAVQIQESKTHDTQLAWVGDDNDFINSIAGTDISIPLKDDTYLIMVGDTYVLFNRRELTEESANVIKKELGI